MKIAIAVHGRFHAFDLARELLRREHAVTLLTNYPKFAVRRFGVPDVHVQSFRMHGALGRLLARWPSAEGRAHSEPWLHSLFGRWAARALRAGDWDVVLCWSGIGEETFRALRPGRTLRICHRSSSHIRAQAALLEEEERRVGRRLDRPTRWIIAREEREYALADWIYVPSTFARQTFAAADVPSDKMVVIPHGVSAQTFRPAGAIIRARARRILDGEPLRVLNVGTFSFRKGMWDTAAIIRRLGRDRFRFRFVGPVAPESAGLAAELRPWADFVPAQPQPRLPDHYAWGDVFILPTIEDGYPFVLAQASAAGLPILTTPNGAGTDLVREGQTGWVLPVRSPEAFMERLHWCDSHRAELAAMVQHIYEHFQPYDWADVAARFERLCAARLAICQTLKPRRNHAKQC